MKSGSESKFSCRQILAVLSMLKGESIERAAAKNLTSINRVREAIESLVYSGLLSKMNEEIKADAVQKMKVIYLAVESGCTVEEVSKVINWMDFEELVAEVLETHGFKVRKRLRVDRLEIDVLAVKGETCLAIDCKHWSKPLYESKLREIINLQVDRCKRLILKGFKGKLYPVVVTLIESKFRIFERVPVVPVKYLNDFILEFEGLRRELLFVKQ